MTTHQPDRPHRDTGPREADLALRIDSVRKTFTRREPRKKGKPFAKRKREETVALKGIDLSVTRGEVLGVAADRWFGTPNRARFVLLPGEAPVDEAAAPSP